EPNTPGAPGVVADARLAAAVTDAAAFDKDGSLNLNKAIYVRFFDKRRVAPPEAVVILVPQLEVGAASYRIIAKEIVSASGGRYEAWALDHRGNLLEDLTHMAEAEREMTLEASTNALQAYVTDPAGVAGALASNPFLAASFASEWGLDVYLRDIRSVVNEAARATPNVFMGGQAFGAIITQMFAAYDFGDTAGYKLLKGMVFINGTVDFTAMNPVPDEIYLNGGSGVAGLNQLREPSTRPFQTEANGGPRALTFQIIEIGSQFTIIDRDDTGLQRLLPFFVRFPATNMAFMGLILDDEFQPNPIARVSIGFLKAPPGGSIHDVATRIGDDPSGLNPNGLWSAKDPGPGKVLQWDPGAKDLTTLGPEFVEGPEVSTASALMRNALLISAADNEEVTTNDANSSQWFFPKRLRSDIQKVIDLDSRSLSPEVVAAQRAKGGNPITLTHNRKVNLPMLGIHASQAGPGTDLRAYNSYRKTTRIKRSKFSFATLDSYTHSDLLTSLEPTTKGRKNAPQLVVDFIQKLLRGGDAG
ncbi:MAG: hypothetical protein ACLGJB_00385, partial [Blastocatellia bacterium]